MAIDGLELISKKHAINQFFEEEVTVIQNKEAYVHQPGMKDQIKYELI